MSLRRVLLFMLTVILFAVGLLIYQGVQIVEDPFRKEYAAFRSVRIGMTENEVLRLLGQPHKIYEAAGAPDDYYVPGYAHKKRKITHKVFIYVGAEPIVYVYFDYQNRVEDVFVGGS